MINFSGEKSKFAKVIDKSTDADFIPVSSGKNMADPNVQQLIKSDGTVNVGELRKLSKEIFERESKDPAIKLLFSTSKVSPKRLELFNNFSHKPGFPMSLQASSDITKLAII